MELVRPATLKELVRSGQTVQHVALVQAGDQLFPFLLLRGDEQWVAVRHAKRPTHSSMRDFHHLIRWIRDEPMEDSKGGFGFDGDRVTVYLGVPRASTQRSSLYVPPPLIISGTWP